MCEIQYKGRALNYEEISQTFFNIEFTRYQLKASGSKEEKMASMQASKGSSERNTPDLCSQSYPCAPLPAQLEEWPGQVQQASTYVAAASHTDQTQLGYLAPQYTNDSNDYNKAELAYEEIRTSQLATSSQQLQYEGPHKVVPAAAPTERQMTDAEKFKADKEQFKLNLQNFRKTQKTAKQVQLAKQAAALQAQKSSNVGGINSTYQAFDLQNYKSPMDCFVGLQSAKRMLQQPAFHGTTSSFPQQQQSTPYQNEMSATSLSSMSYGQSTKLGHQPSSIVHGTRHSQVVHHPPPPQARRKRGHDINESDQLQPHRSKNNNQQISQQLQPHSSRRLGRFVPQDLNYNNSGIQQADINQNVHPNLATIKLPYLQNQQQCDLNKQNALQMQNSPAQSAAHHHYQIQNTSSKGKVNQQQQHPQQKQTQQNETNSAKNQQFSSLSAQIDEIVNYLNYDQERERGEICQLFKQKYQELMLEHDHAMQQQNLQVPAQEPNLSLLLQLVQNDLHARQQKQQSNGSTKVTCHSSVTSSDYYNLRDGAANLHSHEAIQSESQTSSPALRDQESQRNKHYHQVSNPSQTSEQQSVSSTVAVINQDEEDEVDDDRVMISDDDEDEDRDFDHQDDEDSHSSSGLYAQQSVNCFPGDQTEAFEHQRESDQHHSQQLHGCIDQQYHQFSQSDYVEAVEGFSPDHDDDEGQICYDDEDDEEHDRRHRHHQGVIDGGAQPDGQDFYDDGQATEEEEELDHDSQYIEEEHQFALNQLYAQAHKQMLANGQSKEELRACQAVYPRLFAGAGGLTPQNLEQIISLGQTNLTPQQVQEILNYQQKQISEGLSQHQHQHKQSQQSESHEIMVDVDDTQQDPNQYNWCSQDSDEEVESNYEGEVDDSNNNLQSHGAYSDEHNVGSGTYQEQQNLIHSTLKPPSHLSLSFQRFFSEFENNIDFILRYDYDILPQQRSQNICKSEQKRIKNKYENLLTQTRDMCRRFTGPHSVLQIFIEKIVASVNSIAESLKESTLNELGLWFEVQVPLSDAQQQLLHQRKQQSNVLIGHHKRSSSANPELLITKTSKTNASDSEPNAAAGKESDANMQQQTTARPLVLRPKPLLECIDKFTLFLRNLRAQYLMIMRNCAPKISKHFTKLTAVIVENTQYEFPSLEIHKAVISKLIINDTKYFKNLVLHMQKEFQQQGELVRANYPDFVSELELFLNEVDQDMRTNQTKIDIYMRDLRKHALDEYEDLYRDEQELIKQGRNAEGKKKRRKNRRKNKNAAMEADGSTNANQNPNQTANNDSQNAQTKGQATNHDSSGQTPNAQHANPNNINGSNQKTTINNAEATAQAQTGSITEPGGKKKKRNRRNKKKAQDTVTNELLNNLDTDDLVEFINNGCSKKEDLKKNSNTKESAANANIFGQQPVSKYSYTDRGEHRSNQIKYVMGEHKDDFNLRSDLKAESKSQNAIGDSQEYVDQISDSGTITSNAQSPQKITMNADLTGGAAHGSVSNFGDAEFNRLSSKNYRSKRKRKTLRAQAQKEELQRQAAATAEKEVDQSPQKKSSKNDSQQQKSSNTKMSESGDGNEKILEDGEESKQEELENRSDAIFEELLESFQQSILSNSNLVVTRKLKPNLSKSWLESIRKQLNVLEKKQKTRYSRSIASMK